MFTTSPAFRQSNAQQVQEVRVIAPKVEIYTVQVQPRQFCNHGVYAGVCPACGASE